MTLDDFSENQKIALFEISVVIDDQRILPQFRRTSFKCCFAREFKENSKSWCTDFAFRELYQMYSECVISKYIFIEL